MADDTGELGRISAQVDKTRDAVTDIRLEVNTIRVEQDHAPTDEDLEAFKKEVRKEMGDIASNLVKEIRRESRRTRVRNRRDIQDAVSSLQKQWLTRGFVVLAILVSFLISGIEGALRFAQASGFLPHF